jgi:hypothetical protein
MTDSVEPFHCRSSNIDDEANGPGTTGKNCPSNATPRTEEVAPASSVRIAGHAFPSQIASVCGIVTN